MSLSLNILKGITVGLLAFYVGNSPAEVLWWQVDGNSAINKIGGGSETVENFTSAEGYQVNAARLVALYDGNSYILSGWIDYEGRWESEYVSCMRYEGTFYGQESVAADLSGLSPSSSAYSFVIELGNVDENGWDDPNSSWTTLATSEVHTYYSLLDHMSLSQLDTSGYTEWNGRPYNVPEPTAGLMMLIGTGLLVLRRKRRV